VTVARRILRDYQPRELPTDHVPTRRERALEKYGGQLAALATGSA
jgi:acyl-CoA dehydrogenase